MFAAALVAWLVAFLGDSLFRGARRAIMGSPEQQALVKAMDVALQAPLLSVPSSSRSALMAALQEQFTQPPSLVLDGHTRVRTGIIRGIHAQIAPLADPSRTPYGRSFFQEIGIDHALIRDELSDVIIRSIEQVGPAFPALTPLLTQINADVVIEKVDEIIGMISIAQSRSSADAVETSSPRPAIDRPENRAAPSVDWTELLTEAFLKIPAIEHEDSREAVFDLLPDRLRHGIPRSRYARIQVVQMINTSAHYSMGLRDIVRAIRIVEGDSEPMRRLDELILSFDEENGPTVTNCGQRERDA